MEDREQNFLANMFRVCIDSYQEDISGRAYSPLCEEDISFVGIGELLLKMDRLFDYMGYPQAFQNKRSFEEAPEYMNAYRGIPQNVRGIDSILQQKGRHATYDISVESRRNTSWQGIIYNMDGTEQGEFSGEVELLAKLMELARI